MTSPGKPLDLDGMEAVARDFADAGKDVGHAGEGRMERREREMHSIACERRFSATFDPPTVLALIQTQRELVGACQEMVRLANLSFAESLREPEENGNYAAYERAKRAITKALGEQPL